MTASREGTTDDDFPRRRALLHRISGRPAGPESLSAVPQPRTPSGAPTHPGVPEPRSADDDPDHDAPAWFSYVAAGDQVTWSEPLGMMLGYSAAEGRLSRRRMMRNVHRDDQARLVKSVTRIFADREPVHATMRLVRADGSWFDVDCRMEPVVGSDGVIRGVRGSVRDVSARERARREVARLTRRGETVQPSVVERDSGTGLLTRARFVDEVDRALRRGGGALLVLRVEPEHAGEARSAGHRIDVTADLLHRAARVLESVARPDDLIGRVGPSEIGVLLAGTSWPMARRQTDLFVEALGAHPFVLPDAWLRAHAWAGLVRYRPDADAGCHDLLIDAEHACRQAREAGRPVTAVGQPVPARERQGSYRARVADALGTEKFSLYTQPILELQTNAVTRHEVLLRVLDDLHGPQSPVQVLDTAEHLDAVLDIDLWVVERALQLAADRPDLCLQVNLSGRSVGDPQLSAQVERMIERYAVNPEQLTFEITETALIRNLSEARRFTDRVRDLGCQLALDDFGSGYASFRYLRLFPIDLVKIDGEYVVDLVDNPQDQVLVRALVQVCQAYGIHTVAEFVQDEPTLSLLREFGVDYAQGYLIGRPEPVDVLLEGAGHRSASGPRARLRRPPTGH